MVYKNKTFCDFKGCDKFIKCGRAFTITHERRAKKSGLDVVFYMRKPDCFVRKDG